MGISKSASRKKRLKFKKKHPECSHIFGSWMYGETVCNKCKESMPLRGKY